MSIRILCVLFFATVVYCLASCKTAEQLTYKAIKKDKAKVAEITRTVFPCIVTANDTINTIDTLYDFIEVQCPDSVYYRVDSFETIEAVRVPVYIKVPVSRVRETRTVTIRIKDSATVFICEQDLDKERLRSQRSEAKAKRRGKINTWLWLIVIGLGLWTFRKPLLRLIKPV